MRTWISRLKPSDWSYANWRTFFMAAALWNILAAIPAIIWPEHNMKIFYGVLYGDDYAIMLNRCFWMAVLVFGIGYAMASRAPEKQTGIIFMGVLGKVAVAINWFSLVLDGQAAIMAFLGAAGDSLFTVYFIFFLISGPREPE